MRRWIPLLLFILVLSSSAYAQQELGALRVGTSSATFLKIGISPRAAAMGGAWTAMAEDASAAWHNPAGLARGQGRGLFTGYVAWPAGIHYANAIVSFPSPLILGNLAIHAGSLSTTIEETDEYHPYGTGRSFAYSDLLLGVSFARLLTDQLLVGVTAKYIREDLGSAVGGPVSQSWLVDVGTLYRLRFANTRIGMVIQNFGPQLKPPGEYWNDLDEKWVEYEGYPPPSNFKLGVAFDPWRRHPWSLTQTIEMHHLADNRETLCTGVELNYLGGVFSLRGGYDMMSDTMGLSAGFGANFPLGPTMGGLDYSFTDGQSLGGIHRCAFRLDF